MSHEATTKSADAHGTGHSEEAHHAHGIGEYLIVFFALMVLLFATVGAAYVDLDRFGFPLNVPVAYTIAGIKALLILWFFMHLKQSSRLVHVFAFASFAWLALMLIVTLGDYVGRYMNLQRADPMTEIRMVDSYPVASGINNSRLPGASEEGHKEGEAKPAAEHKE